MLITTINKVKAADIIRTAEQLQKSNLKHTEVNINVFHDHISVVHAKDDQLLSYIKREGLR